MRRDLLEWVALNHLLMSYLCQFSCWVGTESFSRPFFLYFCSLSVGGLLSMEPVAVPMVFDTQSDLESFSVNTAFALNASIQKFLF